MFSYYSQNLHIDAASGVKPEMNAFVRLNGDRILSNLWTETG